MGFIRLIRGMNYGRARCGRRWRRLPACRSRVLTQRRSGATERTLRGVVAPLRERNSREWMEQVDLVPCELQPDLAFNFRTKICRRASDQPVRSDRQKNEGLVSHQLSHVNTRFNRTIARF